MSLVIIGSLFWAFALISIIMRAVAEDRFSKEVVSAVKVVPAVSALMLVLVVPASTFLFHYVLAVTFLFCALGDIAMEYDIVRGLTLFLVAQLLFSVNFLQLAFAIGPGVVSIAGFAVAFLAMLSFSLLFRRYLGTAETPVAPRIMTAITIYAVAISLAVSSAVLLWISVPEVTLGWILPLGTAIFVVSDSMIASGAFHHHIKGEGIITLSTYYVAIFLIALSAIYYVP